MARSHTMYAPEIRDVSDRLTAHGEITTACYENEIPEFVATELDQRYGSLFSSLLHLRLKGRLSERTSTYVTRQGNQVMTILLFQNRNGKVEVLNELISITENEIRHFANHIFSTFGSVCTISFHAIQTQLGNFPYLHQQFYSSEDIVISLPETSQAYLRSLGKNTRRNIKRYTDAILRSYPSYSYRILPDDEVSEELIRYIIEFNKIRMADKNKISAINDEDSEWIIALAKTSGLVGVVTIDGRICAGSVCCRVADNYYMQVIAHDPAYNEFSLGTLCCYQTICECIDRGGKELHFLWGRLDYKYILLGEQWEYDQLDIYRTRMDLLRNAKVALRTALTGYLRETKFRLLDCERREDAKSRAVTKMLKVLRWSKRSAVRLVSGGR